VFYSCCDLCIVLFCCIVLLFFFIPSNVCCGTGTIGLTLAPFVKKVIGIEMVEAAIEDARHNAEANGLLFFLCV